MIPFEQALVAIEQIKFSLTTEVISFTNSLNRVLAQDVCADIDMPPFDKSAMDGYAVMKTDLDKGLRQFKIIATIAAGDINTYFLSSGQCCKIMTGAAIPKNADFVVKIEDTKQENQDLIKILDLSAHHNICFKGEDVKKNSMVLHKGTLLKPQDIAVLAAVGCTQPLVYCKPKIAVFSTGTELVEPHSTPNVGQIRNSNSYQILAQLQNLRIEGQYLGIIQDDYKKTEQQLLDAYQQFDMVILSGGVSAGDFDWIPQILQNNNFDICFHKIAVKPGKPTLLAQKGNKFIIGLPGNPVSSFIIFELLVKKLIFKYQGFDYKPKILKLRTTFDFQRRDTERLFFMPVQIDENSQIIPVDYHGSGHIHALCNAHAVAMIPIGQSGFNKGDFINVRLL